MALPAMKFEMETPLEELVGRLEANVEHIQKDVADIKIDIRRLNDKTDPCAHNLLAKIDAFDQKLAAKIDGVRDSVTALAIVVEKGFANIDKQFAQIEKSFGKINAGRALDRVLWSVMSAALLAIMACGLEWP